MAKAVKLINENREKVFLSGGISFNPASYTKVDGMWELEDVIIDNGGKRFTGESASVPVELTLVITNVREVLPQVEDGVSDVPANTEYAEVQN